MKCLSPPKELQFSPLLSNLYLHEVLDHWFEHTVKLRLQGRAFLVRFADDAVLAFEREADTRRVLAVLPKRLGKYEPQLHPEKTWLVDFRQPGEGSPGGRYFDLLEFSPTIGDAPERGAGSSNVKRRRSVW